MQSIFTPEQVFKIYLEVYISAQNFANQFIGALFDASYKEILKYFGVTFSSLIHGDWNTLATSIIILLGMIVFVYRLARKKPLAAIKSIFGKF